MMPGHAMAADGCAAFMETPKYRALVDMNKYVAGRDALEDYLIDLRCGDEQVIALMQGIGWTYERRVERPLDNEKTLIFCDRREGWLADLLRARPKRS